MLVKLVIVKLNGMSDKRYKTISPYSLKGELRKKVLSVLGHKQDDFCVTFKTCGYRVWVWDKDLPIMITSEK